MREGWLLRDGDVVASAVERGPRAVAVRRLRAELAAELAVVLPLERYIHTIGAPSPIDLALLDARGGVVELTVLAPWRVRWLSSPVRTGVVAPVGLFERTAIGSGDVLEFRGIR